MKLEDYWKNSKHISSKASLKKNTSPQNNRIKIEQLFFSEEELMNSPSSEIEYNVNLNKHNEAYSPNANLGNPTLPREYLEKLSELLSHKETEYIKKRKQLYDEYNQNRAKSQKQQNNIFEINNIKPINNQDSNNTSEESIDELNNLKSELSNDNKKELWDKLDNHISINVNKKPAFSNKRKKNQNKSSNYHKRNIPNNPNVNYEDYLPKLIGISTIIKNTSIITQINSKAKYSLNLSNNSLHPLIRFNKLNRNKNNAKEGELKINKTKTIMKQYQENNRLMKVISSHIRGLNDLKQKCKDIKAENQKIIDSIPSINMDDFPKHNTISSINVLKF